MRLSASRVSPMLAPIRYSQIDPYHHESYHYSVGGPSWKLGPNIKRVPKVHPN